MHLSSIAAPPPQKDTLCHIAQVKESNCRLLCLLQWQYIHISYGLTCWKHSGGLHAHFTVNCHKKGMHVVQVLVVLPPGTVSNIHPVYALQVGPATGCAPADRHGSYQNFAFQHNSQRYHQRVCTVCHASNINGDGSKTTFCVGKGCCWQTGV